MIYNFDELSFQILSVITIAHKRGSFDVEGRPYASLTYRISGRAEFNIDGQNFVSNAGDLNFVPAGANYKVKYTGGEMIVIHFLDCNYHTPEIIALENGEYVKQKFYDMLESWEKKHAPLEIKAIAYRTLQKIAEAKANTEQKELFSQMADYVNANFSNPELEISDIAEAFYTSVATVRRRFVDALGISPKQYMSLERLRVAKRMLREGEYSVGEVARSVGFSDQLAFSRFFLKQVGISPRQYRSQKVSVFAPDTL